MKVLLLAGVGLIWLSLTAAQVRIGGDELALWRQAVQVAPLKPRPWVNLGTQYAARGDVSQAQGAYRWALRLADTRPEAERTMTAAVVHTNQGRLDAGDFLRWMRSTR